MADTPSEISEVTSNYGNPKVRSFPQSTNWVRESASTQPTLEELSLSVKRIENALVDLSNQIVVLNTNLSKIICQQQPLQPQLATQIKHRHYSAPYGYPQGSNFRNSPELDPISELSLEIAKLSTSVAQILTNNQEKGPTLRPSYRPSQLPQPPQPSQPYKPPQPQREREELRHNAYSTRNIPAPNQEARGQKIRAMNNLEQDADEICATFENMGLRPELLQGTLRHGLKFPTSIQQRGIPLFLKGQDIIAQAQPGNEKIATYSIPILQLLDVSIKQCQALVVTSSNECANLIYKTIVGISTNMPQVQCVLFSRTNTNDNERKAQTSPHIIVGTFDRISELINLNAINMSQLKIFVLDDADTLLNLGYKEHLLNLFNRIPDMLQLQKVVFSADVSAEIMEFPSSLKMRAPVRILVKRNDCNSKGIHQYYLYIAVDQEDWKLEALADLLDGENTPKTVVFCNTQQAIDAACYKLCAKNVNALALHSDMGQTQRHNILSKFRTEAERVLVTTDTLVRNLDVHQIPLIINFDLPLRTETYAQRISCAASPGYGRQGVIVNLVTPQEQDMNIIKTIEKVYRIKMSEVPINISEVL